MRILSLYCCPGRFVPLLVSATIGILCYAVAYADQPVAMQFDNASEGFAADSQLADDNPCPTAEEVRRSLKPISTVSVDVEGVTAESPHDRIPQDCFNEAHVDEMTLLRLDPRSRGFAEQCYRWSASGLSHKPLYFEDIPLERYGQTHLAQPAISGIRFFSTVAILPYKLGLNSPHENVYTLGYQRPGNCVAPTRQCVPFSFKGVVLQAAAVTGFIYLFP